MKRLRTLHIYGSTRLESDYCPDCQAHAFILGGKFSCCGKQCESDKWKDLIVEVDTSNKKRQHPGAQERKIILEDQENKCFYCGDEFGQWRHINGTPKMVRLQWDHVVPFSYNGNNHEFVAACAECNIAKRALHFSDAEEAKTYLRLKMHERKSSTTT